jgi:hypothetical protein
MSHSKYKYLGYAQAEFHPSPHPPTATPSHSPHTRAHTPENPMEKLKLVIFYDFIKIEIKINSYMILRFVLVVFFYMNTRFFLPFF